MEIFLVQICLGIILFFLINWIGAHSFSVGYREISLFVLNEDSPAINFLIRVLTPIVYLLITSTILYALHLDKFVSNFYWVNIYSIVFRFLFNMITGRRLLLNWLKQVIYWVSIVSLSILVYDKLIRFKKNLLPDLTTISNELWIIILVFVFQLLNSLNFSGDGPTKRKDAYLREMYSYFKHKYGRTITANLGNDVLEIVAYSILIYENFNRPRIIRWLEYAQFWITKRKHSLGVMQYPTSRFINDKQSVDKGTKKIRQVYDNILAKSIEEKQKYYYGDSYIKDEIIEKYNGGSKYLNEVNILAESISVEFYPNSTDVLNTFNISNE